MNDKYRVVELPQTEFTRARNKVRYQLQEFAPQENDWIPFLLPGRKSALLPIGEVPKFNPEPKTYIAAVEEKHYTHHYLIENSEDYGILCVYLIKERQDYFEKPSSTEIKEPDFKPDAFQEGTGLRKVAEKEWEDYNRNVRYKKEIERQYALLQRVLENNDYAAAVVLIELRSDYEYERVRLEEPSKITLHDLN